MIGMETARPIASNTRLPFAIAATAMTLSRLMTMSATTTIRTARHKCATASTSFLSASLGHEQLGGDIEQRQPADQLEIGQQHELRDNAGENQCAGSRRRRRRSPCPRAAAAAADPRHAIAMTTALSPDSRMLMKTICSTATQNAVCPNVVDAGVEHVAPQRRMQVLQDRAHRRSSRAPATRRPHRL